MRSVKGKDIRVQDKEQVFNLAVKTPVKILAPHVRAPWFGSQLHLLTLASHAKRQS